MKTGIDPTADIIGSVIDEIIFITIMVMAN